MFEQGNISGPSIGWDLLDGTKIRLLKYSLQTLCGLWERLVANLDIDESITIATLSTSILSVTGWIVLFLPWINSKKYEHLCQGYKSKFWQVPQES